MSTLIRNLKRFETSWVWVESSIRVEWVGAFTLFLSFLSCPWGISRVGGVGAGLGPLESLSGDDLSMLSSPIAVTVVVKVWGPEEGSRVLCRR